MERGVWGVESGVKGGERRVDIESGEQSVETGDWRAKSGEWGGIGAEHAEWKVECEWRAECGAQTWRRGCNGKWRMENGELIGSVEYRE